MEKLPDIDQITAFMAVAEELSFKRAAERLAIDASALSRRIKELETRLGFPLFFRTTQRVELTDAGRRFYDGNQNIVGALRETIASAARISRGRTGHLRIAYMTFAGLSILPLALAEYRERYPELSVSLLYQPTQEQKVSLARNEIDIGLMLGPFSHSEFEVQCLSCESLLAAMPEGHRLAGKEAIAASDLRDEHLIIGTDRQWDFYRSQIEQALAPYSHEFQIEYEASNMLGMLGLVKAGLGLTIVPGVMRDYCPRGVTMRCLSHTDGALQTIAVWRRPSETKVQDFVDVLKRVAGVGVVCRSKAVPSTGSPLQGSDQ
jgi:LysR family transcriptional regulator, benzoate and cis,cis-muconate-responsive activator of ben and cat genes